MKLLPDHKWPQNEDVDRGGVLQEDRVRCGRMFGGPYKKEEQRCVDNGTNDAEKVDPQALFSGKDEHRYSGEQAAKEGDLVRVE